MDRGSGNLPLTVRALAVGGELSAAALTEGLATLLIDGCKVGWIQAVGQIHPTIALPVVAVAGVLGIARFVHKRGEKKSAEDTAAVLRHAAKDAKDGVEILRDLRDGTIRLNLEVDEFVKEDLATACAIATGERIDGLRQGLVEEIYHTLATAATREQLKAFQSKFDDFGEIALILLWTQDARGREQTETLNALVALVTKLHEKVGAAQLAWRPIAHNNFAASGLRRNPDFVGREVEMVELHRRLGGGNVALTHALSGDGGIGKSELAKEFVFRHADEWDGVWWLEASEEAAEAKTFGLAASVGIEAPPTTPPEQVRGAVCAALSRGRHLLVLDNLETGERLRGFTLVPPSRILVTTRIDQIPEASGVEMFDVQVLSRAASIALLRKHREDLDGNEHDATLGLVAEQLGDHALALAFAAAYLRRFPNVTPLDLLGRLQRAELGEAKHIFEGMDPRDVGPYKLKVAASLSLHLSRFKSKPEMALLNLAAFCHPASIPIEVFFDAMNLSREEVEGALRNLAELSLIEYKQTISLHRLTQEVARSRLAPDERRASVLALVSALRPRFVDALDYRNWAGQDRFAAHARAALSHALATGEVEGAGNLGNQLGLLLQNRARFDEALAALLDAERIDRAVLGDNHPEVAAVVNNIGGVLLDKGDLGGVLERYREAERICRAVYGDDHPNVAIVVNNIGGVLRVKGDFDGALERYRESERIDRAAYGADHPNVAIRVNNIGSVLQDKGDLDGALECFREAERIDRAALVDDHPNLAIHLNNIGSVLQAKGDLDGALRALREVDRIFRAAFGNEHPHVATCVNNIGSVQRAKGDLDGALERYREAERIDRATFGDNHPEVATDVNNIGSVLLAKGDVNGARAAYETAFRIVLHAHGPRNRNVATFAFNLASVGGDPLTIARSSSENTATELRAAMAERVSAMVRTTEAAMRAVRTTQKGAT